jgi:hypothetical protein
MILKKANVFGLYSLKLPRAAGEATQLNTLDLQSLVNFCWQTAKMELMAQSTGT